MLSFLEFLVFFTQKNLQSIISDHKKNLQSIISDKKPRFETIKPKTLGLLGSGFFGFMVSNRGFYLILLIFTSYHHIKYSFLARIGVFYLILLIFTS